MSTHRRKAHKRVFAEYGFPLSSSMSMKDLITEQLYDKDGRLAPITDAVAAAFSTDTSWDFLSTTYTSEYAFAAAMSASLAGTASIGGWPGSTNVKYFLGGSQTSSSRGTGSLYSPDGPLAKYPTPYLSGVKRFTIAPSTGSIGANSIVVYGLGAIGKGDTLNIYTSASGTSGTLNATLTGSDMVPAAAIGNYSTGSLPILLALTCSGGPTSGSASGFAIYWGTAVLV